MRSPTLDRRLMWVSLGLMLFGLLTLYSAGQTDVPTHAAGVWYRQFFWFVIGVIAGWMVFHVSLRLLEWLAPADEPQLIVGGIMENVGLHDPLVVRNVYLALRRYILGPDSSGAEVKVQISVPEDGGTILTQPDEGPVPVPPEPDSTPPPDSRP